MVSREYPYGFRICGPCSGERRLTDAAAVFAAYSACDERLDLAAEAYLSAYQYPGVFAQHLRGTGSTKGYSGPCWAPWVWVDIDVPGDLAEATDQARRYCATTVQNADSLGDDDVLVFFSGSKGYHIGLPTVLLDAKPAADFHQTARAFCEHLASEAGVSIDTAIYDRVRAFRAPNSRHPKTGLYKRRLRLEEVMHLAPEGVVALASSPGPFEVGHREDVSFYLARCWADAQDQARVREKERATWRTCSAGDGGRLSQATRGFLRDGAETGERARRLFAAAAELTERGCPPDLVHSLLEEPALDSGLTPSEVRRQVACGCEHVKDDDRAHV